MGRFIFPRSHSSMIWVNSKTAFFDFYGLKLGFLIATLLTSTRCTAKYNTHDI